MCVSMIALGVQPSNVQGKSISNAAKEIYTGTSFILMEPLVALPDCVVAVVQEAA